MLRNVIHRYNVYDTLTSSFFFPFNLHSSLRPVSFPFALVLERDIRYSDEYTQVLERYSANYRLSLDAQVRTSSIMKKVITLSG